MRRNRVQTDVQYPGDLLFDRDAALRSQVAGKLANELGSDPKLGDAVLKQPSGAAGSICGTT